MNFGDFDDSAGMAGVARTLSASVQNYVVSSPGRLAENILAALNPGIAEAADGIQDARARAALIVADPRVRTDVAQREATSTLTGAYDTADAALATYTSALSTARTQLTAGAQPKLPSGTGDAVLAFKAGELVSLLEAAGGAGGAGGANNPDGVIIAERQALDDALASGDAINVYIIAGSQLLASTHKRLGVIDMGPNNQAYLSRLNKLIASSLGNARGDAAPAAGAELLAALSVGGKGSVQGFRDEVAVCLATERNQLNATLAGYLALAAVQGQGQVGPGASPFAQGIPQRATVNPAMAQLVRRINTPD